MPSNPVPVDLRRISLAFSKADWRDRGFSYAKAYVCSIFSQWAYAEVSQFDLDQAARPGLERFGLFQPSAVFSELIRSRRRDYFRGFIREQQLEGEGDPDDLRPQVLSIVYDELWVFIAFRLRGILFITVRGTTFCLRDFVADLEIAHYRPFSDPARAQCGFHRGFYFGAVDLFGKLLMSIQDKLNRKLGKEDVIYVTGHSLGGALASVLHGYWNRRLYDAAVYPVEPTLFSTYTFGMPRYGNRAALDFFEGTAAAKDHPHHVLHPNDPVPQLIPRSLDYADSQFGHSSVKPVQTTAGRRRFGTLRAHVGLLFSVRYHGIEKYIEDVKKLI